MQICTMHDARCTMQDPVLFLLRAHHETIAKLKDHFPDGMRNRGLIWPEDELYKKKKKKKGNWPRKMPLVRVGENHNFGSGLMQYPFCSPFFGAFLQSCRTTYCTEEQKDSSAWRLALRYLSVRTRLDPVLYPLD